MARVRIEDMVDPNEWGDDDDNWSRRERQNRRRQNRRKKATEQENSLDPRNDMEEHG